MINITLVKSVWTLMIILCSCRIQYLPDRSCGCNHYLPFLQVFIILTLQETSLSWKALVMSASTFKPWKTEYPLQCIAYTNYLSCLSCGTLLSTVQVVFDVDLFFGVFLLINCQRNTHWQNWNLCKSLFCNCHLRSHVSDMHFGLCKGEY